MSKNDDKKSGSSKKGVKWVPDRTQIVTAKLSKNSSKKSKSEK